ncbi:MAG: ATP-binding protein [Pseudonocardia sp.]|nr:ATP-binding protein [Pseudonocardia sp.]
MEPLIRRNLVPVVREMLGGFRLVVLGGARQTGKSTLVDDLLELPRTARFTLDDPGVRNLATADPVGFLESLPRPSAIDEFQRAGPDLLLAVKQAADRDRTRGQLLLTGSADYLAGRGVTETLAGRAGRTVLWPLSGGERRGRRETFVDRLFDATAWPPPRGEAVARADLVEWMLEGGYPEVVTERLSARQRGRWFDSYVADVVSREALRPLADVRGELVMRRVLRLLAARTAQELVVTDLARDAELDRSTATSYLALLEALFLVIQLPAFATSATTRAKRRPKVLVTDPGLAAHLTNAGPATFGPAGDSRLAGSLFETTVLIEVAKQATWSEHLVDLSHFRDRNGPEVDLLVEDRRTGAVAGVEVKLGASPTARDARHLALLRDALGDRFTVGVVLHTGPHALPLGERLWAVPVSALWRDD